MKVWNRRDSNCPKDAVYVGRPSKWSNPFKIGRDGNRDEVIAKFRAYALERLLREPHWLDGLRGVEAVVCWCAPQPCHADVLLELANK